MIWRPQNEEYKTNFYCKKFVASLALWEQFLFSLWELIPILPYRGHHHQSFTEVSRIYCSDESPSAQ